MPERFALPNSLLIIPEELQDFNRVVGQNFRSIENRVNAMVASVNETIQDVQDATVTIVRKTADESVTSSTVLQDDNHLFFTAAASSNYIFEATILSTEAGASPDLKWQWIEPDGTFNFLYIASDPVSGFTGGSVNETSAAGAHSTVNGTITVLNFRGLITTGGTGGTFKFQFAQNSSSINAVTVKAGSYLTYVKAA